MPNLIYMTYKNMPQKEKNHFIDIGVTIYLYK